MNDQPQNTSPAKPPFAGIIGTKAARKLKARQHAGQGAWFGFRMFGLIGWSVVVPTLIGAAVGRWLDRHHPGNHSWTLALLVAGLCLGCWNAWHWVAVENQAMHDQEEDHDE